MYLTARERACLQMLGHPFVVSADVYSIGDAILKKEDAPCQECEWIGSVITGSLETRGLVKSDAIGFWSITPKGRAELREKRQSRSESSPAERYAVADANHAR